VRYADTVGYHGDQEQHIQAYRGWVISALNANMPFDQFTREQLAGDLLEKPSQAQRIATGYNRVLQTSHEGGVQPKEYLAIYAADHVRNLSAVWMGATLGCAQCHDHKYDPYTTRDFYSMSAFFADVDEAKHLTHGFDISPTIREPEMELPTAEQSAEADALGREIQRLKDQLQAGTGQKNNSDKGTLAGELKAREAKLEELHKNVRTTMITVAIEPRVTRVLARGNWQDESGEVVAPAVPEFLGKLDTAGRRATRLDLANWLTDAKHGAGGLTARVMANRFWYLLFGRGLAASLDDLGGQGFSPDHPELLDRLALEFIDSGWDVKHALKLIVMSRTYRQSSQESEELRERDPLNKLVARQGRYRYPAETVRDAALSIAGLLNESIGGESDRPYQPAGYFRHLNFPVREYQASTDDQQWRRGVYMHWQRQYLHPMLKAFDAPTREECTAQRPRSNTALASLVLLNDPTFTEAARVLAAKVMGEGAATNAERINLIVRRAATREADPVELGTLEAVLSASQDYYGAHPAEAEKLLAVGLKPVPQDVDQAQLAAWTCVARAVLNLNEVYTRN
jgi:hypothetical protein